MTSAIVALVASAAGTAVATRRATGRMGGAPGRGGRQVDHWLHQERPEEFNRLVLDWIADLP